MGPVNGKKDVTIRPPAARSGGKASGRILWPGENLADGFAALVTREPDMKLVDGGISDRELIAELARDVKRLEGEKKTLQIACSTIANAALSLARLCLDANLAVEDVDTVKVPKETVETSAGGRISLDEDRDGNLLVRIRDRVGRDFAIE